MDVPAAIDVMSALAQPTRLSAMAELVRVGREGLPAGELAARIGIPPNSMSAHLAILTRAGLVAQTKAGRTVTCRAVVTRITDLASFLTAAAAADPS